MSLPIHLLMILCLLAPAMPEDTDDNDNDSDKGPWSAKTFSGLKARSVGPALMSGRIGDIAVNPDNPAHYYAAACSGGVWATRNNGITWTPVFDTQGSYSIGCLALDPHNPEVLWVGTGENNSQRSVSFGDGVYRSRDGGAHWEHLGLKESEHIGMIAIDPRDSATVYVAAQGPLWKAGGERGLYKTTDDGKTWQCVLSISEHTGVNEVHLDPRNPDVIYASSYQRRRRVWTLINGGPESGIHKSTDGGQTWRELKNGIPKVDKGRIGLDISPANPDVIYAIVEAADDKGGFFRSTNRGETWTKRSDYMCTSPQYYNEIVCDPHDVDRIYTLDTIMHVSEDGGKSFSRMPRKNRHVDDHALWIDPANSDHLIVGCDGGVYDSYDRGEHWAFKVNLPITQFYRVAVDNSEPFYYIYGGTQDNSTLGGPSRTTDPVGITNDDWFITVGGDGFEPQVDPLDPNLVYSQWQYGGLVLHDRRSGQIIDIKPREAPDEEPLKWNWDSPLLISPHEPKRVYFAANKLYRTEDRGSSWTCISPDLSRGLDRNALKVMDMIQSVDAVSKNRSTSIYGNCVALTESPLQEDLLYVGTDDGLIQMTRDAGKNWLKYDAFDDIPKLSYVSSLLASQHDKARVYATFDDHKSGNFKPYILRSNDHGTSWTSIVGDLPDRHVVYALAEDHVDPDLLFAGTEFGAFFTRDGGTRWIKISGLPTIAVRDVVIQERENDLVLATFGRGFYVLDDYDPLRQVNDELFASAAALMPVKQALRYVETSRLGGRDGRGWQGASFYAAENPTYGAVFTYYIKDKLMSRKERRQEHEKKLLKDKQAIPFPSTEDLRAEDHESDPEIVLTVQDSDGQVVRRMTGPRDQGIHRVAWNLRYPASTPIDLREGDDLMPWETPPEGPLAVPGTYQVTLSTHIDGILTRIAGPESFEVVPLDMATFEAEDRTEVLAFHKKVADLQRAVRGAIKAADEADTRLKYVRKAIIDTPAIDPAMLGDVERTRSQLNDILTQLRGDRTLSKHQAPTPISISSRVSQVIGNQWYTTSAPTHTQREAYRFAGEQFADVLSALRILIETDLVQLERRLEDSGAPWTPGRVPTWVME